MNKDPKRQRAGKRSRTKGKVFERTVVNAVKEHFASRPWAAKVRRSDQSHRAALSDVTGWPGIWCECETGANVNPSKKLMQAIKDCNDPKMICIAVTRKKASPAIKVTLLLIDTLRMFGKVRLDGGELTAAEVTVSLDDFFAMYDAVFGPFAS